MSTIVHVTPTDSEDTFRVREFFIEDGESRPSKIFERTADRATAQALLAAGELFVGPVEDHRRLRRERLRMWHGHK